MCSRRKAVGNYRFIGNAESALNVFAPLGAGYVTGSSEEKMNEDFPSGYSTLKDMEAGKESGFTLNLGVALQYNINSLEASFCWSKTEQTKGVGFDTKQAKLCTRSLR